MLYFYLLTAIAMATSCIASRQRTAAALKLAGRRLLKIAPAFMTMMILFSVTVTLVPQETIARILGKESGWLGVAVATATGSIVFMPGFIAFPLSGALLQQGAGYMVLAAFTTTLMMVGVLTYPLERRYFGRAVTLLRNAISLAIALAAALAIGLVFGELRL